jgi:hypothetical protein
VKCHNQVEAVSVLEAGKKWGASVFFIQKQVALLLTIIKAGTNIEFLCLEYRFGFYGLMLTDCFFAPKPEEVI